MQKIINKEFIKNTLYAFGAQFITLSLSVLMSLVVPKILGVQEFAYWQLFLFYSTYVGFFHLGLTDGVYLKLGGQKYEELDKEWVSGQFWMLFIMQIIFVFCIILGQSFFCIEQERQTAIISASVYMVIANLTWYIGYVFQAVNCMKNYAVSVILDRIIFLGIIILGIMIPHLKASFFIYSYIISKLLALIYLLIKSKDVIDFKIFPNSKSIYNTWNSIKVGINLTISSVSSIFTIGIGRFIVDFIWGIEYFGKFSFSLSLTNFFLTFISQISLVLFPTLRRANREQMNVFYEISKKVLGIILPLILVLYIPIKYIIGLWLPQYNESLNYLALLLPLCIFDGKMQLLCNTFFKVLRKERFLLFINIISMCISILFALIGGLYIKNINFILIGMVLAIAFRSVISEIYLEKFLGMNICDLIKYLILEFLIIGIFMISSWNLSNISSFCIMIVSYTVYIFSNKKNIHFVFDKFKQERILNGKL